MPGGAHNLQTHGVVMVRGGRLRDMRSVPLRLVRGKYDLLPLKNRNYSRTKYGIKKNESRFLANRK